MWKSFFRQNQLFGKGNAADNKPESTPAGNGTTFESGSFTLSADGGDLTLNGVVGVAHKVKFVGANVSLFAAGQIITNVNTGFTGIIVSVDNLGGDNNNRTVVVLYTEGAWTAGDNITTSGGGNTIVASVTNYIITIPTAKTLKLFLSSTLSGSRISQGRSDGTIQNSIAFGSGVSPSQVYCIYFGIASSWTGQVLLANIRATEFDITLTQVGAGLAITSQFHLQEQ